MSGGGKPDWTVIVAVALAGTLALLGDQMLYVVLPSQPEAAGIGVAALGVILSVNRFIRLGANSLGGALNDRLGRRQPFLLGMTLALLSTLGYLLSSSFWPLLVARLLWGISFALLSVGGYSIVLDLTAPDRRGRTLGVYQSLLQCGTLIDLLLAGFLSDRIGYRWTLAVYAPLTVIGCLVAFVAVRETAPAPRSVSEVLHALRSRRPRRASPSRGAAGSLVAALRGVDPRLLAPAYATFASFFAGSGILMATLGMYLKEHLAPEAPGAHVLLPVASLTGMLLASRRLVGMVAAPLAGHLSDRLGERRLVARAGAVVSLAGFVVLGWTDWGLTTIVLGVGLTATGEGILHPAVAAWVGDAAPLELRGTMMGGLATANDLGAAIGPIVAYGLAASVGLDRAYTLGALLMLTAVLALTPPPAPRG